MQRTRWIVVSVLVLVGCVWIGQGVGILRGSSFMVGDPFWAAAGVALVAVGAGLAGLAIRRRRA